MRMLNRIFTSVFAGTIAATSAHAVPSACNNAAYRRANPTLCQTTSDTSFTRTALWAGGAVAAAAGVAALAMGMGGGSGSSDSTSSADTPINVTTPDIVPTPAPSMPTMQIHNTVGYTNPELLAAVRSDRAYIPNSIQYDSIHADYSLARGYTGKTTTIGILDTGTVGWHGTAVAHIAGGAIAPDATVHSHQVVDTRGDFIPYDDIAAIIASDTSANVFNASWGIESQNRLNASTIRTRQQMAALTSHAFVTEMVNAATANDAIFVWAAGNEGRQQSTALAALPRVISELDGHFINVVAWDNATGALADYSNACGVTKDYCLTAPGSNLNVQTGIASGTSFAAPVVTAAVAVLREAFPYMTATEITNLLFTTARDLGDAGVDEVYGWGMLDLERATRPVGATLVAVDNDVLTPMGTARAAGVIGRQIKSADLKFAFFDSFGRAFTSSLNDNIQFRPLGRGYDRLHGDGNALVTFGNMEMGLMRNTLLASDGFLRTGGADMMGFVGFRDEFNVGNARLFHRSRIGFSNPRAATDSMIRDFSNIISASVTLGAQVGDWTFSVGTPDTIVSGDMTVRLATGRNADGRITYANHRVSLAESRPALEYTASYKFMTAGYIDNPGSDDEFYIMAKANIRF